MPNGCVGKGRGVCLLIVIGVVLEVGGIDGIVGGGWAWCVQGVGKH